MLPLPFSKDFFMKTFNKDFRCGLFQAGHFSLKTSLQLELSMRTYRFETFSIRTFFKAPWLTSTLFSLPASSPAWFRSIRLELGCCSEPAPVPAAAAPAGSSHFSDGVTAGWSAPTWTRRQPLPSSWVQHSGKIMCKIVATDPPTR